MNLLLDARRVLLEGLFDFPDLLPTSAPAAAIEEAAASYRDLRRSPHGWILGRFLCRTSQIEDLAGVLTRSMQSDEPRWRVGAVFDESLGTAALHAAVFDRHMDPAARVVSAEVRAQSAAAVGRPSPEVVGELVPQLDAVSSISNDIVPFFGLVRPPTGWNVTGVGRAVESIASASAQRLRPAGAQLRFAWGSDPTSPAPDVVASFLTACVRHGVRVKLSVGEPARLLNLLVAVALAWDGEPDDVLVAALEEPDLSTLSFSVSGVRWRGRRIGVATLAALRSNGLVACESGNFTELVHELSASKILPEGEPHV